MDYQFFREKGYFKFPPILQIEITQKCPLSCQHRFGAGIAGAVSLRKGKAGSDGNGRRTRARPCGKGACYQSDSNNSRLRLRQRKL